MTCVDGRRAEDGEAPVAGGVAPAAGQRQGCWVGETTSPRLLKKSYLQALANIRSLTTTPGHSDPAEITVVYLIWNPAGQRRHTV